MGLAVAAGFPDGSCEVVSESAGTRRTHLFVDCSATASRSMLASCDVRAGERDGGDRRDRRGGGSGRSLAFAAGPRGEAGRAGSREGVPYPFVAPPAIDAAVLANQSQAVSQGRTHDVARDRSDLIGEGYRAPAGIRAAGPPGPTAGREAVDTHRLGLTRGLLRPTVLIVLLRVNDDPGQRRPRCEPPRRLHIADLQLRCALGGTRTPNLLIRSHAAILLTSAPTAKPRARIGRRCSPVYSPRSGLVAHDLIDGDHLGGPHPAAARLCAADTRHSGTHRVHYPGMCPAPGGRNAIDHYSASGDTQALGSQGVVRS
jgi:hypothetical protein